MIGIVDLPSGGMGNRLLNYHALRQIARQAGVDHFHLAFPEAAWFVGLERRRRPWSHFRSPRAVTSHEIRAMSLQKFVDLLREEDACGRDVLLVPPFLGEMFFPTLIADPNEFFVFHEVVNSSLLTESMSPIIGIHIRGGDFQEWNPLASLDTAYYKAAILFCLEQYGGQKPEFFLSTDDIGFSVYQETLALLKSLVPDNWHAGMPSAEPINDFFRLSRCNVLISSPSTFAVLAGCLGGRKRIIHSRTWLDYAVERKDPFWVDLLTSDNPYYSLWATV